MNKVIKQYINSIRCPLCGGQIDGFFYEKEWKSYCVKYPLHYALYFVNTTLISEVIEVHQEFKLYSIMQYYVPSIETHISCISTDIDGNIIEGDWVDILNRDNILFDFRNVNKQQIINRLKILLTFQ